MSKTISVNVRIDEYTSRVLGVIKEKYGLKDKGKALDKFAELCGSEFLEPEVKEEVIREVIESCDRHIRKYGFRSRSVKDLRKIIEAE
ncbi:MAG TPA: hypothetical protein VJK05_05275 [archaeon]|nr:hypothetical protein [archaeon]